MNNAPAVYVPTQPEGNGLTLPTLLSLLAHSIVIGILIYNYQSAEIETTGSIETVMVSPEQLAEMQGQILANRAAASDASQAAGATSGTISNDLQNPSNTRFPTPIDAKSTSQRVPIFLQSNNPADAYSDEPILMSQEQHQRFIEQSQEYERNIAEWSIQQDDIAIEKLDRVDQEKQSKLDEKREQLKDFRAKQNDQPKIEKPNSSQRNIKIDPGGSENSGKNYNLSDGQSTISGDTATSSPSKGSSRSASSGSRGASNSEIINLIKRNYNPPIAAKGSTQRATLTITVNAKGDVVNVSVSGSDSAVNDAAKQAVLSARNLPIDADDPKYPTFTIQFNGSN